MLSIFPLAWVTNYPLDVSTSHKSPAIEEVEDEDILPQVNIPPQNPHRVLESSDDDKDGPLAGDPSTLTRPKVQHSQGQSQSVDDVEDDEDTYNDHVLSKKLNGHGRKKPRAKPMPVVESSDDQVQVSNKKKHGSDNSLRTAVLTASQDSDIEEIVDPKENSDEELGESSNMVS